MERRLSRCIATSALISLAMTGCQATMIRPHASGTSGAELPEGGYTNVGAEWPLKFRAHYFRAVCYSTYGCRVHYGHYYPGDAPDDELQISSGSVSDYPNNLRASWGPISNFPAPAKVTWRSKDGTPHEAEIDIGEIFKDQLVRHNLSREDISEDGIGPGALPGIILEVNDRTINVYMRAHISTRELQIPGNRYSDFRDDLIKVFSRTY